METAFKQNVLVVEDDPFWQRVIQRNLEKASEKCSIHFAGNAREAMALLNNPRRFHLIISDQYLDDGKTGYELWFECKKRGVRAAFVLTSGYTKFTDEVARGLPLKFVSKPFTASEFRRMIRDLLGARAAPETLRESFRDWIDKEDVRKGASLLFATLSLLTLAVYFAQLG
jgi:DNA-binding NtrC family response regulator